MAKSIVYFSPYNGGAINVADFNTAKDSSGNLLSAWWCPYTHKPLNRKAVETLNLNFGVGSGPQELRDQVNKEVLVYENEILELLTPEA